MSWKTNLFAITAASFIGFTGFTLVMPFLPLYFQQLGVADVGEVALWSGVSLGATPAVTALMAPFWGRLADRLGRKIMVERSLVSFVVVMAALAFVTEPWHVFALRAVQGLFAGYGALTLTMAADSAPPGRMAYAIGVVQTSQRLGPALGPVIGGLVAQIVGLRRAFLVTSAFYVAAVVLVFLLYREPAPAPPSGEEQDGRVTFRSVLAFQNFILLMAVIFCLQFVDRSFGPVLPLYVSALGTPIDRVPLMSGILFSLAAGAAAAGNQACAWLMKSRTPRRVLTGAAAAGSIGAFIYVVAGSTTILFAGTALFGLAIGVASTAAYTAAGTVIPAHARGSGFGLLTTASLTGLALSPIAAGLLGAVSIRAVFLLDTIGLLVVAVLVRRVMVTGPPAAAPPAQDTL